MRRNEIDGSAARLLRGGCPRRRAVAGAAVAIMPENWYTTLRQEDWNLRHVHNGNTQRGLQEKARKDRPRQNVGRVAGFCPQAMRHARRRQGLSGVCRASAFSQREIDCCPDVSHEASSHRISFWLSWMLPRCGGCSSACRRRVADFKRERLRLAGERYLSLGRSPRQGLGVGREEIWAEECCSSWRENKFGALPGFDGYRYVSDSWVYLSGIGRFRCQTADQWQVAAQARLSCHKHGDGSCGDGARIALRYCALSVCRGGTGVSQLAFLRPLAHPDFRQESVSNSFSLSRRIGFLSLLRFSRKREPFLSERPCTRSPKLSGGYVRHVYQINFRGAMVRIG